ncbi:hypothetical protein Psuf_003870 [Phytohabitans suffuscus]|uniref:Uncharacterized protein n=1 Tax=Phytohabitans suffuscus TaxID=624315 RepID=A0A6F8YAB7_9ACTN|nr:hypothetical protein Psuf_003870 [Phytohabitans suffuscus]
MVHRAGRGGRRGGGPVRLARPFTASDLAGLIGLSFLGGEAIILLGEEQWGRRVRGSLRSVGQLIRRFEEPS